MEASQGPQNFIVSQEVLVATLQYLETQPIKQAIGLYNALQRSRIYVEPKVTVEEVKEAKVEPKK